MLRRAATAPRPVPRSLTVGAADAHMRLDRFVRAQVPSMPQSLIQRLARRCAISIAEPGAQPRRATTSERLREGMTVFIPGDIEMDTAEKPTRRVGEIAEEHARLMHKSIIYEDKDIIAINKPSGIPVQGGTKSQEKNIDRWLPALRKSESDEIPRLLHRLDKDTSGILLLARTRAAAAKYSQLFARKTNSAEKCYLALVTGVPEVEIGRIKGGLKKEWKGGREKVVNVPDADELRIVCSLNRGSAGAKLGITEYEVLDDAEKLRVHCAEVLKCPVIGDRKYAPSPEISTEIRLHLHAYALRLPHPSKAKEKLILTAPLPPHMLQSLKSFGMTTKPKITWSDPELAMKEENRKASFIVRQDKRYAEFRTREKKVLKQRRERTAELQQKQKTKRALRDKRRSSPHSKHRK